LLVLAAIAKIGEPGFDRLGQSQWRRVAIGGVERHRLQADHFERGIDRSTQPARRGEDSSAGAVQHLGHVAGRKRSMSDEYAVQRPAQAVNVAGRTDALCFTGRLLRAHVLRSPEGRPWVRERWLFRGGNGDGLIARFPCKICQVLGYPPIDDQRFAKPPEHDVVRLDIAVHDAAAVRVCDRVAGVDHAPQQAMKGDLTLARLARAGMCRVIPV
jgi:hypothetical protein